MPLAVTVAPAEEPITLAEAKAHLGVDFTDDDARITVLIQAAREVLEHDTGRAFITRTLRLDLDAFPTEIRPPLPPLIGVTQIDYYDEDGASQTLSSAVYLVDSTSAPARIVLAPDQSWPTTQTRANAVSVTYTAGYGTSSSVPEAIKAALKMEIQRQYDRESREDGYLQAAIMNLLAPVSVPRV